MSDDRTVKSEEALEDNSVSVQQQQSLPEETKPVPENHQDDDQIEEGDEEQEQDSNNNEVEENSNHNNSNDNDNNNSYDEVDEEQEVPQQQQDNDNDLSEVDEDAEEEENNDDDYVDDEDQILTLSRHKKSNTDNQQEDSATTAASIQKGARRAPRALSGEPDDNNNRSSSAGQGESRTLDERATDNAFDKRQQFLKKLDDALKSGNGNLRRRKKGGDIDLEQMQDAQIQQLKNQMQEMAYEDAKCVDEKNGLAMNKLKLLPKVKEVLLRKNLADSVLDNNLLESIRVWLEPLPDGSLPAYEIQKVIFQSLQDLPIKTIHLRESGLGKVVLFYQKSKRVEPGLKRIADKLVGDWTRPILNLSDNYHDKYIQQEEFDINQLIEARRKRKAGGAAAAAAKDKTLYEETAARRKRAAAPQARATAYKIAPKVNIDSKVGMGLGEGIGSSLNRDDQYKRIQSKLQNRGKRVGAKKAGVSIEGRNLHI